MPVLNQVYYHNSVLTWIIAFTVMVMVYTVLYLFKNKISYRLLALTGKTRTDLDDQLVAIIRKTKSFFLIVLAVFAASLILNLPPETAFIISRATVIALLIQIAFWMNDLISLFLYQYTSRSAGDDRTQAATASAIGYVGRIILFTVIVLLILDNLGVKIDALIAGLGIGGIAVALALQTILGDLFGSLSIVLDKPFLVGDFIIIDECQGTVEKIGLKSTRIRSLAGEQLIFSNHDLLNSRIRNLKKMVERRIAFTIGVTYETPYEKLGLIPKLIQGIIESQAGVRFDRAHFKSYGAFSLDYEIVYFVLNPDYNFYMDVNQAINLAVFRVFEENQIQFAYPTQTLYVNNSRSSEVSEILF